MLYSGQWFAFYDDSGPGYCQIDHYILLPGFIILVECKLTQTEKAEYQMEKLYVPILHKVYGVPVISLQICKNVRYHLRNGIQHITDLIKYPRGGVYTWHYLG